MAVVVVRIAIAAAAMSAWLVPTVPFLPADAQSASGPIDRETVVRYKLRAAVRHLVVAGQTHAASYDRDADFGDWVEQGAGCDTRAVVLKDESLRATTQNADCTIAKGRWFSYYNATYYMSASEVQVDHVVSVKNVWVTGGWRWNHATRVAYYNDLSDPRTLVAVDAHDNESKGDQTPDEWLPPDNQCRYIREFVSVKLRWQLTATRAEKAAMVETAAGCPNVRIRFVPATIQTL